MEFTPRERQLLRIALQVCANHIALHVCANHAEHDARDVDSAWCDDTVKRRGHFKAIAEEYRELKKRFREPKP